MHVIFVDDDEDGEALLYQPIYYGGDHHAAGAPRAYENPFDALEDVARYERETTHLNPPDETDYWGEVIDVTKAEALDLKLTIIGPVKV